MAEPGAPETYAPDVGALKEAGEALKGMQGTGARTAAEMKSLQQAMATFSRLSKEMSKAALVDPRAEGRIKKLKEGLEGAKVTQEAINKLTEHEVSTYEKLSILDKMRVRHAAGQNETQKRMVMYGNKMVEMEAKKNHLLSAGKEVWQRTSGAVVNNVRGLTSMVTSAAGFQLSLMGILALFMKMRDQQNRIGAMSMQSAAQWQGTSTSIGTASKAMSQLRGEFGKTVDEAGSIIVSMARIGVEEKGITNVARELVAIQELHGISVQESLGYMGQLAKSYEVSSEESSQFLRIARETTKTIPYLSMSEVSSDMMDLTKSTRSYNTDLLDTLSLYNTLMKKDVAKHLGLGDAPEAVRKDIVKVVAGFNTELGDGWKASLGEGATAAAKILNFEKLLPAEQFAKMAKFITEKTSQYSGAEQEFAVRQLLKQFNFTSAEMQQALAKAFTSGGFSAEGLQSVVSEVAGQREIIKKAQEADKTAKANLMKDASTVAKGLMDFETKLALAIEAAIFKSDNGKLLMSWVGKMQEWLIESLPGLMENLMQTLVGVGEVIDGISSFLPGGSRKKTAALESKADAMSGYYGKTMGTTADKLIGEISKNLKLSSANEEMSAFTETMHNMVKTMPLSELNAGMQTLKDAAPDLAAAINTMSDESKKQLYSSIALSGISSKQAYGSTGMNEVQALMKAYHDRDVPALFQLLRMQLLEETNIQKQLGRFSSGTFVRTQKVELGSGGLGIK